MEGYGTEMPDEVEGTYKRNFLFSTLSQFVSSVAWLSYMSPTVAMIH